MSTITLPNIRVSSDLTVSVRLKDNDVAIDWSTLSNVKASIYSDAQRALAGRCDVSVDAEDHTVLVCQYAANKPQYVGVCRIVVSAKYMGETKTYDKPAFNFVRWTADQDGEQITIDDPDVDVEIEVSDVSSSLLDEAIRAAFAAAEEAVDAKGQVLETEAEVEAAEALRVSAEESRVEAEEGRVEAEAARVDEEAVRVSAEDARVVAENARAAAEDLREGAEDDRAAAETARETAEAARVAAEALRVTAEDSRETAEAARVSQASADHTVAAGDHTQAAADHTQAAADHTTAASDHTQAGADHTLAAADHVTAGEDHAQAQDDHEVMAGYDTRLGNVEGEVSQLEAKVDDFSKEIGIPVDYRYSVTASGNLNCPYVGKAGDKLTIKLLADGVISPSADIPIYAENGNNYLCNITPGGQHEVLLAMDITQFYIYLAASNFIAPGTITLSIVKTDSVIGEYLPMNYTGKVLSRTANLFNYNDKLHYKQIINDSGVWSANSSLSTVAIPLEAGKTYYKYSQPGTKNSWGGMSTRIFDGNGTFVLSTTTATITVPDNIVNPIGYFRYYHTGTGGDITKFMVLESGVDGSSYIPYYTATYEQTLLGYIKSLIKPTTGTGEDVTMSQKAITDALAAITPEYRFAERPESGYENFLVSVDTAISNTSTTGQESADTPNIQQDRCIISIPESYSRNGEPTRLIIIGHGTGWTCTSATTQPMGIIYVPTLLNKGYAVLGWNGTPGDVDGLANGNNGTPQCYRSLLAAYKYVTEKYNIARDGVLTAGYSMGTLMTAQIACFTDIPVLAQVFFSAGFELMKGQFTLKPSVRQRMCQLFGFAGTAPTFTEQNPPSQAEKDYVLANFDKWAGFDPVINGFCGKALETFAEWPASSTASDADEAALYEDKAIVRRVPTKFIYCADDTTASPRWSKYVAKMMRNAGCYVEVREYATGGHNSINAGTYTSGIPGAQYEAIVFLERFNH